MSQPDFFRYSSSLKRRRPRLCSNYARRNSNYEVSYLCMELQSHLSYGHFTKALFISLCSQRYFQEQMSLEQKKICIRLLKNNWRDIKCMKNNDSYYNNTRLADRIIVSNSIIHDYRRSLVIQSY